VSETKALTSTAAASAKAVRRVERKVIKKTMNLIERGVLDASKINDDGTDNSGANPFEGDERRRRIAMDMRVPKRNQPTYIDVGLRRLESAEKADAAEHQAAPVALNIGVVNVVQAPVYESIDVTQTMSELPVRGSRSTTGDK